LSKESALALVPFLWSVPCFYASAYFANMSQDQQGLPPTKTFFLNSVITGVLRYKPRTFLLDWVKEYNSDI